MKILLSCAFIFAALVNVVSQTVQDEPKRFSYRIWGSVIDEQSQPTAKVTVCLVPAERPINGRIPCAKTDKEGNFDLTVADVPDKYIVSASTGDSPFLLAGDEEKDIRFKRTAPIKFGARDDSRKIVIQFGAK